MSGKFSESPNRVSISAARYAALIAKEKRAEKLQHEVANAVQAAIHGYDGPETWRDLNNALEAYREA